MPSPFPGMDPYLEDPDIFPDFHDRFVTYVSDAIQRELPEPYFAAIGRRVWIHVPHDERIEPLVEVFVGRGAERRLVTAIEVLSLTNKTPGGRGSELGARRSEVGGRRSEGDL